MHLTTAECACRHNYEAVGKLGKTINLKIPWRYENIAIRGQIGLDKQHLVGVGSCSVFCVVPSLISLGIWSSSQGCHSLTSPLINFKSYN